MDTSASGREFTISARSPPEQRAHVSWLFGDVPIVQRLACGHCGILGRNHGPLRHQPCGDGALAGAIDLERPPTLAAGDHLDELLALVERGDAVLERDTGG